MNKGVGTQVVRVMPPLCFFHLSKYLVERHLVGMRIFIMLLLGQPVKETLHLNIHKRVKVEILVTLLIGLVCASLILPSDSTA